MDVFHINKTNLLKDTSMKSIVTIPYCISENICTVFVNDEYKLLWCYLFDSRFSLNNTFLQPTAFTPPPLNPEKNVLEKMQI